MCGRNTRFGHAAPVGSPTVLERRTRVRVSSGRGVDPGEGKAVLKVLVVAGRGWRTHEKPELGFLDGLDRVLPPEHRSALQIRAAEHHERFDGDERCPAWPEVAFPMVQVGSAFTRCPCCPNGPEYVHYARWLRSWGYRDRSFRRWCDGLLGPEDVRTYLTSPTAREAVVAGVADSIVSWQPDVVIGHSLGAVVAVEALARSRAIHAPSAVLTLGAPFPWPRFVEQWSPSAREWLLEPAVPWLNVVDLSDVVTASVIPTPEVYAGAAHLVVDNDHHVDLWPGGPWWDPRDTVDLMSTHRASLYLNHPAVAEVFAALLGGSPAQAA